mgnify:CR=1 FL=1
MFENIKPTDTTIEVALPFYIMSQISNIFYYANIKDKGLTMYDENLVLLWLAKNRKFGHSILIFRKHGMKNG